MFGRDGCKEILQKVLGWSRADHIEALIIAQEISLTRFCNSVINQNVSEKRGTLFISVLMGRRIGSTSTHRFNDQAIQRGFKRATERTKFQSPTESLRLIPRPKPLQPITSPIIRQPDILLPKEQRIQRAFRLYQGIILSLLLK